ncbi:bacteriorhodopsin [Halobacterium sp. KA-6]|uniref:bacteriorhodopsin n=1 Tax=Halobacterium sp. KA-6 TaxID=2896368 RepID=UPI001E440D57|nr:bacteriorhodopsin [Halobacterium sp. KA-6]MCD2204782.1 bacteriorhodopsin [Halobacterium sp. KA-6]
MTPETWFWIGAVGMTLGTMLPVRDAVRNPARRRFDAVLVGVTGVAAVAYALMALGVGALPMDGFTVQLARYADWLVTTPLLVLYLAMLSRPGRRTYVGLVVADVVVITAGVGAALTPAPEKWAFYAVGCLAYVALLYGLLRTLPAALGEDADPRVDATFTTLRNLTVVLWTLYPVVWLLAPTGLGVLRPEMEAIVVVYLDFISKVGFVAFAVLGADAIDRVVGTTERGATDSLAVDDD